MMEVFATILIFLVLVLGLIVFAQYQMIKQIKSYKEYWFNRYIKMREDYFKTVGDGHILDEGHTNYAFKLEEDIVPLKQKIEESERLLKDSYGLIGHPCTGISSSTDWACEDLRKEIDEFLEK